ncbi:hypothetical protein ACIO87_13210 [Streptomyces sp. NPDC087218]|uniref:hypothetical protein n=1 Tax=Streptomyces sp. NPDC087218 TaxID=3365769 RepID=UPI00381C3E07
MSVLTTDHPAWIETKTGGRARVVRAATGVWVLSWDRNGPHMDCVDGTEDVKPEFVTTDPVRLPADVPVELRESLTALGVSQRLNTPWLWDAITTAVLRQVVRAGQARKLYRNWCRTHGMRVCSAYGDLHLAPSPERVLELGDDEFAAVGARFHSTALRAAATVYEANAGRWQLLNAPDLVAELVRIPRIGPWTAAAAASDFTGDFSVYPHDDLAVRTWAAKIAPTHDWPDKKDKAFGPMWTGWAGPDRTALHTLTLSTLTWGSHAR